MKKYSIIAILVIMVFAGIRCSEDFVKPEPLSFYAPENSYNNANGLESVLNACLHNWRGEYYNRSLCAEYMFSDQGVSGETDKGGVLMDLPLLCLPDMPKYWVGPYWRENGYVRIQMANVVTNRIDNVEWDSQAERDNILGKAYFHRANVYYRMVHQYGDCPLILEEITEPRLDFYSCTRESILQKCKKDLEFAALHVDDDAPIGDVNKAAVNHLLTKVNLALCEFDDAIASASAVINDGRYALMTTRFGIDKDDPTHDVTWDLHQELNKALAENTERIMLFIGDEAMTEDGASVKTISMRNALPMYGNAAKIKTPSGLGGTTDVPLGKNVGGYPVEIDLVTKYGRGVANVRPSTWAQFSLWDDPNDQRHKYPNWIKMSDLVYNHPGLKAAGDPWYGKPLVKFDPVTGAVLCSDTLRSWFDWPHYKLYIPDPTNPQPRGGHGDWYCYRLAETYLCRAEAYFWKDDLTNAAADLNAVRTRADAAAYTPSQINIGTILDERARELYYEEMRNVEITRVACILAKTGKTCYNGKTYSLANLSEDNFWYDRMIEKNKFYRENVVAPFYTFRTAPWIIFWPIPAEAINANTLGHINQNEGYPGAEANITPMKWVDDGTPEGSIVDQ